MVEQNKRSSTVVTPCEFDTNKRQRMSLDGRVSPGGFLRRLPDEPLDQFLENYPPSELSDIDCAWIAVDNTNPSSPGLASKLVSWEPSEEYENALNHVEEVISTKKRVSAAIKNACVEQILNVAQEKGFTVGKWMVWISRENVDCWWSTIARATVEGTLGCSAKIAPASHLKDTSALCCIYCKDFKDKTDLKRVLVALLGLGFPVTAGFKPDVFTHLGIDKFNMWRQSPTIYKVSDALSW